MPESPAEGACTCATKRDVLDRVKDTLKQYVEAGTIDREDFKKLAKKSTEAITAPASSNEVKRVTLTNLIEFLRESGGDSDAVAPILELVEAIPQPNTPKDESRDKIKLQTSSLSLIALKERMSRKREELRRQREEEKVATDATARSGPPSAQNGTSDGSLRGETEMNGGVGGNSPQARKHRTEARAMLPPPTPGEVDLYAGLVTSTTSGWGSQGYAMHM
ncbi:hypothetical protein TRVL_01434 [Trypanosoma vivax]|uniref:Uncharacterized protein n=1 Tax=Trypanosoma vivax (strain Y486) TaxID=1055687 RepID=G0U767_TRYVY|nr:hypothetical protein TRVL_01434 [Trypanosoma vivax]CCC51724.1 conserved hypothetical protein [Trypanosoma vivax Y486]